MRARIFLIGMSCLMLIAQAACGHVPSRWFSENSCNPPCWNNIMPGQTNKEELLSILEELHGIEPGSILIRGSPWNIFNDNVNFSLSKEVKVEVYLIDNIVSLIGFYGKIDLTFGEAIELFGEPESVLSYYYGGPGPLFASSLHPMVYAISSGRGIAFGYDDYRLIRFRHAELRPGNQLKYVDFFDPALYEQLADAGMFSMGHMNAQETNRQMVPWAGYGDIETKYPPDHKE